MPHYTQDNITLTKHRITLHLLNTAKDYITYNNWWHGMFGTDAEGQEK